MFELLTRSVFRKTLTSITATILPDIPRQTLINLVEEGTTIFRINLSWFKEKYKDKWKKTITAITEIAEDKGVILGIMLDTMGPEFRVNELDPKYASTENIDGRNRSYIDYRKMEIRLTLDSSEKCNKSTIYLKTPPGTEFGSTGKVVVFGDGKYRANIKSISPDGMSMQIIRDGKLRIWEGAKANFPGIDVAAPTISPVESQAIRYFVIDLGQSLPIKPYFMFAQSFVKSFEDIIQFKGLLAGDFGINKPIIIAKLETYESSLDENLEKIVEYASAVMIARGDLANETSRQDVPRLQRKIIKEAKSLGKPVLLATQVYASMESKGTIHCTRPEAEDVRSALELGVDGFVLTGEVTGRPDPETVVKALADQIANDEKDLIENNHYTLLRNPLQQEFQAFMRSRIGASDLLAEERQKLGTIDFAIAAVFRANTYRALGIFPFTAEGGTVRAMSRFYPETQIYALTPFIETAHRLLLHRCTHPILLSSVNRSSLKRFDINDLKKLIREVVEVLDLKGKGSKDGKPTLHYAIATIAHPPLQPGGMDTLLRIRIEDE